MRRCRFDVADDGTTTLHRTFDRFGFVTQFFFLSRPPILAAAATRQSTPVGTTIFRNIQAVDKDAGVNGLVEYFVVEGARGDNATGGSGSGSGTTADDRETSADGYGTFAIAFPHQGQVRVCHACARATYKCRFD